MSLLSLLFVIYCSIDLVKIAGFGCHLNYLTFNGRFHPLKKDVASLSSSLFDIIITIVVVLVIIVIVISKVIIIINAIGVRHLSCPLSTYDYAASSDACAVISKLQKYCTCLCRVKQAPSHNFRVTECRPDEARCDIWIFILSKGCLFLSN